MVIKKRINEKEYLVLNKKSITLNIFLLILISSMLVIVNINHVSSAEVSFCCEKTVGDLWCVDAPEEQCNTSIDPISKTPYKLTPSSCAATSYCELGTCIDLEEGKCMPNTAERTCQSKGGFWKEELPEDIPQCQLGCCFMGDDSSFVTQTRCKRLSSLYGLEVNFRTDITDQFECLASANPQEKGACVFGTEIESTCKVTTRSDCRGLVGNVPDSILDTFNFQPETSPEVTFYEGRLCSDEALGTICGNSCIGGNCQTTCVEGKDEVYFVDTCGNPANIYDSSKVDDALYWSQIFEQEDLCNVRTDSTGKVLNAQSCGNCDYLGGSICKDYDRSKDGQKPLGDFVCRGLSCEYDTNFNGRIDSDEKYRHGERWCANAQGTSQIISGEDNIPDSKEENLPGSRYYRLSCYNGEVNTEQCADYRQEVCIESEVGDPQNGTFSNALCVPNLWQDCLFQSDRDDCQNIELRDCKWISSGELKQDLSDDDKDSLKSLLKSKAITLNKAPDGTAEIVINTGGFGFNVLGATYNPERYFQYVCIPRYAPGFEFWDPQRTIPETRETLTDTCGFATSACVITYEAGIVSRVDKTLDDCKENCHCLPDDGPWLPYKQEYCASLGDCGSTVNYVNQESGRSWKDLFSRSDLKE